MIDDKIFSIDEYDFKFEGIKGILKRSASDFKVNEIDFNNNMIDFQRVTKDDTLEKTGMFLWIDIWRKNIDHGKMIFLLSDYFGVNEKDITTAGIKDAKAEIIQLVAIFNPQKNIKEGELLEGKLKIRNLRYERDGLFPGHMKGNYFQIIINNCTKLNKETIEKFKKFCKSGILNYYGYQRFGSYRPITSLLGRELILKNYENAVNIFLGGESINEDELFRKNWRDFKSPKKLLEAWDRVPYLEKKLLLHLVDKKDDFEGAIKKLPSYLINLAKSSFISQLFNEYISYRGREKKILKGERQIDENIEIALPSHHWKEPLNEIWRKVFDKFSINVNKDLVDVRHSSRLLYIYPKLFHYEVLSDNQLLIEFSLKNGQYATIVLRELMKSDVSCYF